MLRGGDGRLSPKPLEMNRLKETLREWLPEGEPALTDTEAPAATAVVGGGETEAGEGGPIDRSVLREIYGDDRDGIRQILQDFARVATAVVGEILAAHDDRSSDVIVAAAHKLKSSAAMMGAHALSDICGTLEAAGKSEAWGEIEAMMGPLGRALSEVTDYIGSNHSLM